MSIDLTGRDFLKEIDFTRDELSYLLDLAASLKTAKAEARAVPALAGRNIVLIFEKTSTRTRCAFEVAAYDQGAHITYLDPASSQLGHKESPADTARVLSRMYDAIEFRGGDHSIVEEMAHAASVPVYNGLTDQWHPTQMLADFLTMREHASPGQLSYCYLGDARSNMGNSLLVMGAIMGCDVRIAAPRSLWPGDEVISLARSRAADSGAVVTLTEDVAEAVVDAQFVHTDVWVSMGEPVDVWDERIALLRPYRVTSATLSATGRSDVRFMHCLPAYHDTRTTVGQQVSTRAGMFGPALTDGIEVTNEVFESPHSVVFDQAENRLHTIKAVLVATLAGHSARPES